MKKLVILGAGKLLSTVYSETNWNRVGIQIKKIFLSDVNIKKDKKFFSKNRALLSTIKINTSNFYKEIDKIKPDLILCVGLRDILKKEFLKKKNIKFINLHGALLPYQRGAGGDYGAIVNDQVFGLSTHYINEGIDAGRIIHSIKWKLQENNNKNDLIKTVHLKVSNLIEKTMTKVSKKFLGVKQTKYSYYPRKPDWDEYINWSESSKIINRKIKARDPFPLNFTIYRDKVLFIKECMLQKNVRNYLGPNGQIIGKSKNGILVKTGDNAILITKVAYANKISLNNRSKYPYKLPDKFFTPKFKISEMLGFNIYQEIYELKKYIKKLKNQK